MFDSETSLATIVPNLMDSDGGLYFTKIDVFDLLLFEVRDLSIQDYDL